MSKPLVVDLSRREIFVNGREIYFPNIGFAILSTLVKTNTAMTRDQLADEAGCCGGSSSSRTIDQHIARIRRKLGKDRWVIATIPNTGYRYDGHKKK